MRPAVIEVADGVFHVERRYGAPVTSHVDDVPHAREEINVAVLFTDDHNIQPLENLTALVRTPIVARSGEGFTRLTDAVSGQLTTAGLRDLDARVAGGAQRDAVAARWPHAEGLA